MSKLTYQHLLDLVGGDRELIDQLVELGEIEQRESATVTVDVDRVLVARTLVRELEIDWSGIEVILRLLRELADARQRIAELERAP